MTHPIPTLRRARLRASRPGHAQTRTGFGRGRTWLLLLLLLGLSTGARAADYYWVPSGTTPTGNGLWSDLTHWASVSGGAGGAYGNTPKNTDNVFFSANSFTGNNQRVTVVGTVPYLNMTWSGNVRAANFTAGASAILEINGDVHYINSMSTTGIPVPHRMLAPASAVVDMQGVPFNTSLTFANATGSWTFSPGSTFNGTATSSIAITAASSVNFGNNTLSVGTLAATGSATTTLNLGSSITTVQPGGTWSLDNANLTLVAGTSTLNLGTSTTPPARP